MIGLTRLLRAASAGVALVGLLIGCGGAHSSSTLPATSIDGHSSAAHGVQRRASAATGTDVVAIDAGGPAAAGFAADTDYAAAGTWTYATASTIDTSGVAAPAPQAVYQSARQGGAVAYTIPGLTPGAAYTVRLSFAELWWTAAAQRTFNVSINGTAVLSNFDIVATAGARYKAVAKSFAVDADSNGSIAIALKAVTNNALINGIEILAGPGATPAPAAAIAIDAGSAAAAGNLVADTDFTPAGTWAYTSAQAIDISGVINPAPQAVYQTEREGAKIAYTIPGLTAGATYAVRLDFAELWWKSAGQRLFNVSVNNVNVLNSYDVEAAAGAPAKAVAQSFTATASTNGTIAIVLTAVKDNAAINGIEISPSGGTLPIPTPTPTPLATPTPTAPPPNAFVDWPTYAFDSARSGFNPNTTSITPGSIGQLHVGWHTAIAGSTQSQPIVATNVAGHAALLIVANFGTAQAYDALTGALVWQRSLPIQDMQDCGIAGIAGSAQYLKALGAIFMAAGNGSSAPSHTILYRLDAASGTVTGQVDVTPTLLAGEASHAHSGLTYANGRIYLGTGSNCEGTSTGKYPSWRGRVVAVDPTTMTLLATFFTTWGQGGNYGGGGVWAWGGVSADPSGNIYVGTGNAETKNSTAPQLASAPFLQITDETAGYADRVVQLSADLSTVEASDLPKFAPGSVDLDYAGTPVIYQPAGCGVLSAAQGKSGQLVVNTTPGLGEAGTFNLSVQNPTAYYIGNPAFSPATNYLYAAITSSGAGSSLLPPGLAAIGGCGTSIAWHAQFGPDSTAYGGEPQPRSAPTVTAGGVVFIGTPCTSNGRGGCGSAGAVNGAVWAVDATTGSVLGGGKPVLITADNIRMAPSADGLWLFVLDGSGNLYGLTIDPAVKAVAAAPGRRIRRPFALHRS